MLLQPGSSIPFFTATDDPTGSITLTSPTTITLQPGYYYIAYRISALFRTANYLQVTPSYNGAPHIEYGIYFASSTNGTSACGTAFIITPVPETTAFTLTYSGSGTAVDGQLNIAILKLRR